MKKYVLGYYGRLLAPVDPDVFDRIVANGSSRIALVLRRPDPGVAALRRRYPDCSDDERLLRYMYAGGQVDAMLATGPTVTAYRLESPIVRLLRELGGRSASRHVRIERPGLRIEVGPAVY